MAIPSVGLKPPRPAGVQRPKTDNPGLRPEERKTEPTEAAPSSKRRSPWKVSESGASVVLCTSIELRSAGAIVGEEFAGAGVAGAAVGLGSESRTLGSSATAAASDRACSTSSQLAPCIL